MKTSDGIEKLTEAMADARAKFDTIKKDRTAKVRMKNGGEYTYNYADLSSVIDATAPHLSAFGIVPFQEVTSDGQIAIVTTRLSHKSGQWLECECRLPAQSFTPQDAGSGFTYAKRYALSAILNVSAEDDDDGNAANGNNANTGDRKRKAAGQKPPQEPQQHRGEQPIASDHAQPKPGERSAFAVLSEQILAAKTEPQFAGYEKQAEKAKQLGKLTEAQHTAIGSMLFRRRKEIADTPLLPAGANVE